MNIYIFYKTHILFFSRCAVARGTLVDSLVHKYKQASTDYMQAGEEVDEDDIFSVTSAMKKVSIFYSCHNLGPWAIWDNIYDFWVKGAIQDKGLPEDVVRYAMTCCSMGIMWDLVMLDDTSPLPVSVASLRNRLKDFVDTMRDLLNHPTDTLEEAAFVIICDLLIVFCKQLGENSGLTPLVYEPDRQLQIQLGAFVQKKVYFN